MLPTADPRPGLEATVARCFACTRALLVSALWTDVSGLARHEVHTTTTEDGNAIGEVNEKGSDERMAERMFLPSSRFRRIAGPTSRFQKRQRSGAGPRHWLIAMGLIAARNGGFGEDGVQGGSRPGSPGTGCLGCRCRRCPGRLVAAGGLKIKIAPVHGEYIR